MVATDDCRMYDNIFYNFAFGPSYVSLVVHEVKKTSDINTKVDVNQTQLRDFCKRGKTYPRATFRVLPNSNGAVLDTVRRLPN